MRLINGNGSKSKLSIPSSFTQVRTTSIKNEVREK